MKRKLSLWLLFALAFTLLLTSAVLAAPKATTIDWYVFGSGGGHLETTSATLSIDGTIAQPVAGIVTADLCSGFWCGFDWASTIKILLPLLLN